MYRPVHLLFLFFDPSLPRISSCPFLSHQHPICTSATAVRTVCVSAATMPSISTNEDLHFRPPPTGEGGGALPSPSWIDEDTLKCRGVQAWIHVLGLQEGGTRKHTVQHPTCSPPPWHRSTTTKSGTIAGTVAVVLVRAGGDNRTLV